MIYKIGLIAGFVLIIALTGVLLMVKKSSTVPQENASQKAVTLAKKIYDEKKLQNVDFKDGPCLSENLMPDWVADIAHNPRQPVDDMPKNQCAAFREGIAHHFVELDLQGNVIRIN